ncbi:unnamed protein product [Anisakis simplex]|uniref:Uncharacterized protein n=1 Tax=Anisakis simplex TaxID=6269 RepID=A0A3P6PTX3_ANISI|nr:unnamed protein product [Anisakis simplex]
MSSIAVLVTRHRLLRNCLAQPARLFKQVII